MIQLFKILFKKHTHTLTNLSLLCIMIMDIKMVGEHDLSDGKYGECQYAMQVN